MPVAELMGGPFDGRLRRHYYQRNLVLVTPDGYFAIYRMAGINYNIARYVYLGMWKAP